MELLMHLRDSGGDLDYMNVTDHMMELTKPWEITESPAKKFPRDNKIKCQLVKAGIATQPSLHLALAMSAFKATGKCNAQICKFKAKPTADCTFNNFRPFIVNKYSKCTKQHKATAKSIQFGIANATEDTINNADVAA